MFVLPHGLHKKYGTNNSTVICLFAAALFYVLLVGLTAETAPKTVTSGITTFATKLYPRVSETGGANLIFSPISLHCVLSLAYQGAAAETAETLRQVLDVPQVTATAAYYKAIMEVLLISTDVEVRLANKIYVKAGYQLRPNFRSTAQRVFAADAEEANFEEKKKTTAEVNQWVSKNTANRITELVTTDDFDELTRALLLNGVYFKGKWLRAFNAKYTIVDKFHRNETDTIDCLMMRQTAKFDHVVNERFRAQALEIRYRDDRFSMIVVLPDEGTTIAQMEKAMAGQHARFLQTLLPIRRTMRVFLPKFKIESSLNLKQPLIQVSVLALFAVQPETIHN